MLLFFGEEGAVLKPHKAMKMKSKLTERGENIREIDSFFLQFVSSKGRKSTFFK